MKKTLLVGLVGLIAGTVAGLMLEANTHALQVARLTHSSYFQILERSPFSRAALEVEVDNGGNF